MALTHGDTEGDQDKRDYAENSENLATTRLASPGVDECRECVEEEVLEHHLQHEYFRRLSWERVAEEEIIVVRYFQAGSRQPFDSQNIQPSRGRWDRNPKASTTMAKSTQEVSIRARILNNPHEQEPSQATEQRSKDINRDAELSLVDAVVRARERPGGPVAQGAHEDGEHATRECPRPEIAVLRDVQVVWRDGPDLREDVGRDDEEGDEHGADHEDPEDGRVDEVDEDLREEVRDRLVCVACSLPGREGLHVGEPWGLLRWAWWVDVDCLGLLVPALFLLGSVGAGLGLREVWGSWGGSDELGFWQQEDGCK